MAITTSLLESHRILLVDSYDSFAYNLASLIRQVIPSCNIYIIKNDAFTIEELEPFLGYFAAVVVGPGPGSPDNARDIGVVRDLWKLHDASLLPIFGVCLGLQSLAIEHGARLKRLHVVKHGQMSDIQHNGRDLFKGVASVRAVRYHSLHVSLETGEDIDELAWTDDRAENGRVVMAVRHHFKPFWAVQYHPESVRTDGGGADVLKNFWRLAIAWSKNRGRTTRLWDSRASATFGRAWPDISRLDTRSDPARRPSQRVTTCILHLPGLTTFKVSELFGVADESMPFVLLDSAAHPGRFSIVASLFPASPRLTHFVGDSYVQISTASDSQRHGLGLLHVFDWIAEFMRGRRVHEGSPESPFWGGLVGYLSYELGAHALSGPLPDSTTAGRHHPDVNLVFVERSVVLDVLTSRVFVQSILPKDNEWIADTSAKLVNAAHEPNTVVYSEPHSFLKGCRAKSCPPTAVVLPEKELYIERIKEAKEHLFSGDSYELCLTAQSRVTVHNPPSTEQSSTSWGLFKRLRTTNPAPFSAYVRLHPTTLISSSPERFLSFSRPPDTVCQLRPIKGTVRKAPGVTRAVAEKALAGSAKEVAENLMIVDLIRHDLHAIVGEDVRVRQFCRVEEYETVWQLVSVIEGALPPGHSDDTEIGWRVLQNSLPPGSMTGAPKKRSVEILQTLEDQDRSVYSGVLGYWCAGGGGDWSVIIRSCFKYDDRFTPGASMHSSSGTRETEEWCIGAGGAITALSDPQAEWEEMLVKLQSTLRAFGAVVPRKC